MPQIDSLQAEECPVCILLGMLVRKQFPMDLLVCLQYRRLRRHVRYIQSDDAACPVRRATASRNIKETYA
jgi:hypothetical protein